MDKTEKIFVAGHRGLVGSALVRTFADAGFSHIVTRTRAELELLDAEAVADFFATEKPTYVILAAAKVGGIGANNTYPADFIYENLQIQNNVIHQSHIHNVEKLLFIGSSCIYPKQSPQPMKEEYLLTGTPEPTNEAYAIAKIAGLKLCEAYRRQYGRNFISVMPTNLYGPGDNFDLSTGHVIPSLMRRFHEAKVASAPQVTVWGSGAPMREFLYIDDLASACLHLMETYDEPEIINVGTGEDVTIKELAETIRSVVGYTGTLVWDTTKPDGMLRKLLDVSKLHARGWKHSTNLNDGLKKTYDWYVHSIA
jgi:GDP-L-fucose synthase